MRIAVVEFAGRGGMIHYAFQLARGLARSGAEVVLVTDRHYELDRLDPPFRVERLFRLWDPKPAGSSPAKSGLLHRARRATRAARWTRAWNSLAHWVVSERPEALVLGDLRFPLDAALAARLANRPSVVADVCHNVRPLTSTGAFHLSTLARSSYARAYRRFDRVFVHGETNRLDLVAAYDVPPHRVVAIPHGNESLFEELRAPDWTAERLRRELRLELSDRIVLFFGSLSAYKGLETLLHGFARLYARMSNARLVVAGFPLPGFDLAAHRALATNLGVTDAIRFIPRYLAAEEVAAWMELAEVATFPYRDASQSGALALAQTFGVPSVATTVGALPEAARGGETALLVPPNDPAALSEAIGRILTDRDLAERIGHRAREVARTEGDWDRIAGRILDELQRAQARYERVVA